MHNKIVEVLETLGIDIAFMEYQGNEKEYIIFNVYNEIESNLCDDTNLSETYFIQVNYWFKDLKNINKYNKIKDILRKNNFSYKTGVDLHDDGFYGKSMSFEYVKFREEQ